MDVFWSTPPVTRTLVALTCAQSVLVFAGVLNPYLILFSPNLLFKFPPQIWRLCTSFMMTGPKWSFFFDLYHMHNFGSGLEKDSPRFSGPGDFFTYVVFVGTVILSVL
ncbi:Der1-like family [Aspergillus sclerotialis]|uniref:Derlin n=1 Tax=Aspergillus sclerotialis TaxID=2070753 RepID=A0A3A2ZL66_9EURO|nr:Der1-like family [Aspergillus sclerotialis]